MTASPSPVRRWFVPGDLNGFFGLVVDNLSILGFIAAALIGIFQLPAEVVFTRMFPGTALGVLVGNLIYTWMAHRLAAKTGRGWARCCARKASSAIPRRRCWRT